MSVRVVSWSGKPKGGGGCIEKYEGLWLTVVNQGETGGVTLYSPMVQHLNGRGVGDLPPEGEHLVVPAGEEVRHFIAAKDNGWATHALNGSGGDLKLLRVEGIGRRMQLSARVQCHSSGSAVPDECRILADVPMDEGLVVIGDLTVGGTWVDRMGLKQVRATHHRRGDDYWLCASWVAEFHAGSATSYTAEGLDENLVYKLPVNIWLNIVAKTPSTFADIVNNGYIRFAKGKWRVGFLDENLHWGTSRVPVFKHSPMESGHFLIHRGDTLWGFKTSDSHWVEHDVYDKDFDIPTRDGLTHTSDPPNRDSVKYDSSH